MRLPQAALAASITLCALCAGAAAPSVWGQDPGGAADAGPPRAVLRLSLAEAESRALSSSTKLAILRLRMRQRARAWALGVREYLPRLSLQVDDSEIIASGGPDTRSASLSVTIEQPVFDGGRVAVRRALSRAELLLDQGAFTDEEDALVDAVRGLYWQALVQQEKLRIQEEARDIAARQVEIARTERTIGAIREIDLIETELEQARAELRVDDTRAALEEKLDLLRERLGMGTGEQLALSEAIDAGYPGLRLPRDAGPLVAAALAGNTTVKRRDLEARKALEAVRAARMEFVPRISVALTLSISGERLPLQEPSVSGELIFDFPSRVFPLSTSLSTGRAWPRQASRASGADAALFEDLGGWSDRAAAELARQESLMEKEEAVDTLRAQVVRAAAACEQKKSAASLQRRTVALAESRAAILGRQLELGGTTRVDYMEALAQRARDAGDLLEDVLAVLEAEREIERLLGVRAGGLAGLAAEWAKGEGR
jgi:outer membrane protein TolC